MRKEFDQPNSLSKLVIIGNNHLILLDDEIPDWNKLFLKTTFKELKISF